MRVIKNRQVIEDGWRLVPDGQPLPEGDVIVSWARWRMDREQLLARGPKLGVCIHGDHQLPEIAEDLAHFDMIALEFPKFADGRCFSHARLLRERHGYTGELRAVGDVLRDLLFFMQRCGIDSFQVRDDKDIHDALHAFSEFTVKYQPAADDAPPIYRLR